MSAGRPPPPAAGRATLFLGPMFSGKTTAVGALLRRARLGGRAAVFVKHAADGRYGAGVRTHDGAEPAGPPGAPPGLAPLRVAEARTLLDVELGAAELHVGVDEGQFFPDLPEALERWTREGRHVYVAALDGDYRRRPFGRVAEAVPLAARVEKLSAVCMYCAAGEAPFTVRTSPEEAQEVVGGGEKYRAACLDCYLREGPR